MKFDLLKNHDDNIYIHFDPFSYLFDFLCICIFAICVLIMMYYSRTMTTLPHSYGTLNTQPPEESNNCPNEHDSENTSGLSSIQIVALVAICLTHMADAVEIYLPAILTQEISCDLLLSGTQQGLLSVIFYSFYAAGRR